MTKLEIMPKSERIASFFFHVKPTYNLQNQIRKEVIEIYLRGHFNHKECQFFIQQLFLKNIKQNQNNLY